MPAPGTECIDYTPAKLVYAATGSLKEAAEKTGIGYSAVRVAAHRQDWKTEVKAATEMVQQNVTRAIGGAALSRQDKDLRTRDAQATVSLKAAERLAEMDPDELLLMADTALKYAKHGQAVFGWQQNVTTTLRLDVLASGSSDSSPVIDV